MSRALVLCFLLGLVLGAPAWADPASDLSIASNADVPEVARLQAFDRLVMTGATDLELVTQIALSDDADARQRWVATRALGMIKGDNARETLLSLLDNDMPAMRAAAAQALGDTGDRAAVDPLITLLVDPAIIVRAGAAAALAQIGDSRAVTPLIAALGARDSFYRGSSLWVRAHYVEALGRIGDRTAVPALLRCIDDVDEGVVTASIAAFTAIAGFGFSDGRSPQEEQDAWRRWAQSQL